MMYYDFTAGEKTYKLRLNSRNIVALEKQLGCNPIMIFGDGSAIPTITQMVSVLFQSLQQYQHNVDMNTAYDIFDDYLADGHTMTEFIPVIVEIYKTSGIIAQDKKVNTEKN